MQSSVFIWQVNTPAQCPLSVCNMCVPCNMCRVRLPLNLETDRGVILGEGKPENQNHAIIFCHT